MKATTKITLGVFFLFLLFLFAFVGPMLTSYRFDQLSLLEKNLPPSLNHFAGSDDLGRDVFVRLTQGLKISFQIASLAALIDLCVGVLYGALMAFSSPSLEKLMMRFIELLYSIPLLLVVIVITVFFGAGFTPILIALVTIGWIQMARMTRIVMKNILETEYVQAAYALGIPRRRIFFSYVIPNALGPILTACMLSVPYAIFVEAFLSFLGVGIPPPAASLGSMINDGLSAMRYFPWRMVFPACTLTFLTFSITLAAEGLSDYFDPKRQLEEKVMV